MTDQQEGAAVPIIEPDRTPPKLTPTVALGVLVLVAGLAAWVWLGEWRWAVTGVLVLVALAVVSDVAAAHRRKRST